MKTINIYVLSVIAIVTLYVHPAMGQKDKKGDSKSEPTYVSPSAKLTKLYTKEELQALGKLELTKVYMERITVLTELAPYIALHTKPGATLTEMGIPATPENTAHLQKEVKNKEAYLYSVKETLEDVIPYADKENIIWSILFYDEMIQRIESGK